MKLFLLKQDDNTGYDTHDSMVVAAKSIEAAVLIHPDQNCLRIGGVTPWTDSYNTWASSPDKVTTTYLGTAKPGTKEGVILSSFNAG